MRLTIRYLASALTALAITAVPVLVAGPAGSAPPPAATYDALGDSYASGAGVLPYSTETFPWEGTKNCERSTQAPARLVDGRKKIELDDFAACGGARSADIANQVSVLDGGTDLVTVSIGGNDIFWSQSVTACIVYSQAMCEGALARSISAVRNTLPSLLETAYDSIRTGAPNAHVVVTGYARLFSPEYGDYVTPLGVVTTAEQQSLNGGADLLNATIADLAADHGFEFVDVTKRFDGHGVNAPEPWIGGLTSPAAFHPNLAGYSTYAAAITAAVNPRELR